MGSLWAILVNLGTTLAFIVFTLNILYLHPLPPTNRYKLHLQKHETNDFPEQVLEVILEGLSLGRVLVGWAPGFGEQEGRSTCYIIGGSADGCNPEN
jgi:hypothetical protein